MAGDKWKLLVACTLLNKTSGKLALPVFWTMMDKWPTPWAMSQGISMIRVDACNDVNLRSQLMKRTSFACCSASELKLFVPNGSLRFQGNTCEIPPPTMIFDLLDLQVLSKTSRNHRGNDASGTLPLLCLIFLEQEPMLWIPIEYSAQCMTIPLLQNGSRCYPATRNLSDI